jgi:AAA+ ATPase superfamily predicted ATPase
MQKLSSLDFIQDNSFILIIGSRSTGKSYLIKDIINNNKDIPLIIPISISEKYNCFYKDFINKSFIYENYKSSIIKKLFERQNLVSDNIDKRSLIIFDDSLNARGLWLKDKQFIKLNSSYKENNIMVIMTLPFCFSLTEDIRSKIDYVFFSQEIFGITQKKIYDLYACNCFDTFDKFQDAMNNMPNDYGFMIIKIKTNECFYYKSNKIPKFKTFAFDFII